MKKVGYEEAAEELCELIRDCDAGDLAAIYEHAFGAVKSCEESNEGDYFEVEYHEGLEPEDNREATCERCDAACEYDTEICLCVDCEKLSKE